MHGNWSTPRAFAELGYGAFHFPYSSVHCRVALRSLPLLTIANVQVIGSQESGSNQCFQPTESPRVARLAAAEARRYTAI